MISNTLHVSKVFTTSIATFEETLDQLKTIVLICLQILSQAKHVEEASVEHVEGDINQLVAKD